MFDSTFSPIIAQFQDEEPIPYADDEPILPKEEIAQALDSREDRYTGLLTTVGYNSTDLWWKKIEPALEKGDRAFIEKNPWQLSGNFQGLLQGLWNDTWDVGCFHAVKGLNIANQQAADVSESVARRSLAGRSPGNFNRAEFADYPLPDYPQEPFYTAYPPDYGYPLRNTDLQSAVEQRVLYLANDVNEKTRDRVQASVMNAVSTHGAGGIPRRDRVKLLQQINLALGRQSLEEIKDPDVAIGEKLVRTTLRVPGTQTFRSRAKTIAATEISAAYSLGRLQVYTQANVKRVRWQSLEDLRVCKLCRSRNGIVIELDVLLAQHQFAFKQRIDPTKLVIPCHANDRCLWIGIIEGRKKDRDMTADPGRNLENRQVEPLKGGWNVLKNVIGTTVAIAGAARAIQRGVEDIQRQQLARQQEAERQKQEQARRLARAIMVTGGAALSLGVLYMIMKGQKERLQQQQIGRQPGTQAGGVVPIQPVGPTPQPGGLARQMEQQVIGALDRAQQVEAVQSRPVLPAEILTEAEQQGTLSKLPTGLDLRTVNTTSLTTIYGLTIAEAQMVEELRKQYERDRVTPPEQALVPQFFLPPDLLNQLPDLRQAGNLRDLSLQDLARMILRARGEMGQAVGRGKRLPPPRSASTPSRKAQALVAQLAQTGTQGEYRNYLEKLNLTATNIREALNKQPGTRYETMSDRDRYLAIMRLLQKQRDYAHVVDAVYEKIYGAPGTFSIQVAQSQAGIMGQLRALHDSVPDLEAVERQAQGVQGAIERQVQNVLGLPPARIDGPPGELIVGGINLNTATVEEIARLLPAGLSLKRRRAIAQAIYTAIRRMAALGTPITNLDELAAIPGVGKITVRNLQSRNYTQNLNNLLLQVGDKEAADAIAAMLDIGPKLAQTIVREFRAGGQFGQPGVDATEDLIERLGRRVEQEGTLYLSEEVKNRIRERLAGRMYTMPIPPTQPVGGVQPQGVSSSELGIRNLQLIPPTIPNSELTIPNSLQLPPGAEPPPRRTNQTTPLPGLGTVVPPTPSMPYRTTPVPPTPWVGRTIRQERAATRIEQQELFDRASNAQSALTERVNDYNAQVRLELEAAKRQRFSKKTLGEALATARNTALQVIAASKSATSVSLITQDRLSTTLQEAEALVREFEELALDIDDPLGEDLFTSTGRRKAAVTQKIQNATRDINQAIKQVEKAINTPTTEVSALVAARTDLVGVRDRVLELLNGLKSNSPIKQQQGLLIRDLELELSQLRQITPQQAGDNFPTIQGFIRTIERLLEQVKNNEEVDFVKNLDGLIRAVDEQIEQTQIQQTPTQLVAALEELRRKKDRLVNSIPERIERLTSEQQQAYGIAKEQRVIIDNANRELSSQLAKYRRNVESKFNELLRRGETFAKVVEEWETPGGEPSKRLYEEQLEAITRNVSEMLDERNTQLQQWLNQLRIVTDPTISTGYIMRNIPLYEESKTQADESMPKRARDTPIGLDEAVEVKRRAVASLRSQALAVIEQVEGILNYGTIKRVVGERLAGVQTELAFWQGKQQVFIPAIQRDAANVLAELELLRETDIIAYNLARRSLDAIRQEIETNEQLMQSEFASRINTLEAYRSRLQQDLDRELLYQVGGKTVNTETLRTTAAEIKQEVEALSARRRTQLDDIWVKSAARGVTPEQLMSISNNPAALEQVFTPSEIEVITAASAGGRDGALALYMELATLSNQMRSLRQTKEELWDELQDVCGELERDYGYRLTFQVTDSNELLVSDLEDIEPNRAQRFKTPKNPDLVLAKIAAISGIQDIGVKRQSDLPAPVIAIASAKAKTTAANISATNTRYTAYLRQIAEREAQILDAVNKESGTLYASMGDRERYAAIIRLMQQQADAAYIAEELHGRLNQEGSAGAISGVRSFQQGLMPVLRNLYSNLLTNQLLGRTSVGTPTNLVDVLQQLQINQTRRQEVDRRLEVAGFKMYSRLATFSRFAKRRARLYGYGKK
ncbi:phage minor head protein [Allocoleopsis sp.]|uniref:phage minor head protein n=1 Tax=Allocoleopsis sp. TaxID=3088169 RepID=UPI002FD4B11B